MTPALRAQVIREWQPFAKGEATPVMPSLEKLIPGVMKRMGLEQRLNESQIYEFWTAIVGSEVAKHATPVSLKKGILTVAIDQPIWHQELHPQKKLILQKIRARVGESAVRVINFRIG